MADDNPYSEGTVLKIHRHLPPEPFGAINEVRYGTKDRREWNAFCSNVDYWWNHRVEFALAHPPITTAKVKCPESRTFTVTRTIQSSEDTDGAMVIEGANGKRNELIAKVYDGVYYSLDLLLGDPCDPRYPDVMTKADMDYALESRAYEQIRIAGFAGSIVPNFYGAWTISLPVKTENNNATTRPVRMILLEKIHDARTMKKDVLHYELLPPESTRTEVLRNLLVAYNLLWWYAEVELQPIIGPGNVLIRKDNSVVLINFNYAIVHPYISVVEHWTDHPKKDPTDLCPHPVLLHWPFGAGFRSNAFLVSDWWQWIPQGWLNDPEQAAEWLLESHSLFDSTRFGPLTERFLDSPGHNNRSPKVLQLLEELGRKARSTGH
ncbi:hypothetical protein QBC40DRAFT_173355 [Triangularia verruculosa]|uniref:Uncharacterized protein n=1 Tax=Triangularia verruculosa TaxID=2587418 RepID=A0AAN7AVL0_9PEZI|nr:hypothetical protein QBC40DRAFT_173355 [Triangularia verruculosa]